MKRFLRWAYKWGIRWDCFFGSHRVGEPYKWEVRDFPIGTGRNWYRCVHCGHEIVTTRFI